MLAEAPAALKEAVQGGHGSLALHCPRKHPNETPNSLLSEHEEGMETYQSLKGETKRELTGGI